MGLISYLPPLMIMDIKHISAVLLASAFFWGAAPAAKSQSFVDFGPAERFIEPEIHLLAGASSVTQNYQSCFSEIKDLNINMGYSMGVGAAATFGLTNFIGLGTAMDIMVHNYNIDMAVVGPSNLSVSSLFIDNRAYYLNVPVFMSFRFNPLHSIRWVVNAGFYYGFGFAGHQNRHTYRAELNDMQQLVPQSEKVETDYFHSPSTFLNKFYRGDFGLHLATEIHCGPHLSVGGRFQIGAKNISEKSGVKNPNIHNYAIHALIGYRF